MTDTAHQEKHFENYVVTKLEAQGWLETDPGRDLSKNIRLGSTLSNDQFAELLREITG